MTTLGIALALACAAMANLGMLCKHRGACEAPEISLRTPLRSVGALFRSRWWTIGFAVAAVAWVLHVAAMAVAPLSLVQAVIAGGLVLIAYPATRYFGHTLSRARVARPRPRRRRPRVPRRHRPARERERGLLDRSPWPRFEAVIVGAGCALFASGLLRRGTICHGVVLGARLGPADRRLQRRDQGAHRGRSSPAATIALLSPWTVLAVVGGLGAFFALARGMQLGEAIPVIATASVASNCAAILGGVVVFGDPIGSGVARGPRPRRSPSPP